MLSSKERGQFLASVAGHSLDGERKEGQVCVCGGGGRLFMEGSDCPDS